MRHDIFRYVPAHDGDGMGLADAARDHGLREPVRVGGELTIGDAPVTANQCRLVRETPGALLQNITGQHGKSLSNFSPP